MTLPFSSPEIQGVVETASRKGVTLEVRLTPSWRLTDEELAAAVGAELGQIVKTVVCTAKRPGGWVIPLVCLVSGRNRLDRALLAAVTGELGIRETTEEEALALFGYPPGSIPPFGHGRDVRTVMDEALCRYQWLWAATGAGSAVFRVTPGMLRMLSNAIVAPVAQASWMRSPGVRLIDPSPVRGRTGRTDRVRPPD